MNRLFEVNEKDTFIRSSSPSFQRNSQPRVIGVGRKNTDIRQ